jgi:hypothetical protein
MEAKERYFAIFVTKTLDPDWIRIGIRPKMLDPDLDQMNTDPKHCLGLA